MPGLESMLLFLFKMTRVALQTLYFSTVVNKSWAIFRVFRLFYYVFCGLLAAAASFVLNTYVVSSALNT